METITIPSPSAFLRRSPVNETPSRPLPRPRPRSRSRSRPHPPPIRSTKNTAKRPLASTGRPLTKAAVEDGGISKPKQSKSRNGCITCKGKRLKCDESKPTCEQCRKRNVQCGGYSKAFKWRSFEEANFTGKSGSRPKKVSPPPPPPPPPPIGDVPVHVPSSPSNESYSEPTPTSGPEYHFQNPLPSPHAFHDPYRIQSRSDGPPLPISAHFANTNEHVSHVHIQNAYQHQPYVDVCLHQAFSSTRPMSHDISQPTPIPPPRALSFTSGSPTLRDILLPGTDMNSPPPPMESRPPRSPLPYIPCGYTPPAEADMTMEEEEDVEEIVRTDHAAMKMEPRPRTLSNNWSFRLPSASPSPSESSTSSTSSGMDLWAQPRFTANSKEMLLVQFDRQTCGILSVKDGPNENPWRTMVWPLAQDSKHLYHAIASMTAFHSSKASPELRMDGMSHMHKSVTRLASSLSKMRFDGLNDGDEMEAALATTLVLAFSESWDKHVSTGIKHLKGAKYFVHQAVAKHRNALQSGRQHGHEYYRLKFLCNSFIYMDVLARLTSLEEDDMDDIDDLDNVLATFSEPFDHMAEIDPLMGAGSTLFPLIGRVATIVTRVRKSQENSFTLISDAIELKKKIEQWQSPACGNFEVPEDPTSEVQHSIQTAEAYRWATLLHLHQAVPEIPSVPAAVLADRALKFLATVPLSSRAIIVQIFPLLAASCEAVSHEDRSWVKDRWAAMSARMSIGNVDVCFEVVKEVWERRDGFEAEKAERFVRSQAIRDSATNGLYPPTMPGRGLKRKISSTDRMNPEGFFHTSGGGGGDGAAPIGSESFTKRRTMADPHGSPCALRIDHARDATPAQMRSFATAGMPALQYGMRSPIPQQSPLASMEAEYSVRGRLHWMSVMSDHEWEVLLG